MAFPRFLVTFFLCAIAALISSGNHVPGHHHYHQHQSPRSHQSDYIHQLTIREGEGFLLRLRHNDRESGCKVIFNGETVHISPGETKFMKTGEMIVSEPEAGFCSIGVSHVKSSSAGRWTVQNNHDRWRAKELKVIPADSDCPQQATADCKLINLEGSQEEEEERECGSDVSDWPRYKCQYKVEGSLSFKEEIFPKLQQTEKIHFEEPLDFGYSLVLECKTNNAVPIHRCFVEHLTSGRMFNVVDGLQGEKYSAFQSQLAKGICQFEIPKRFYDQDLGRWTMRAAMRQSSALTWKTCEFQLVPPVLKDKRQTSGTKSVKHLLLNEKINCAEFAAHKIRRCSITTPSREIRVVHHHEDCEFELNEVGTWTCGHNAEASNIPDILQEIEVHDNPVINGKVDRGAMTVQCQHIYKEPLRTCLFVSPNNKPFGIPSEAFKSPNFEFFSGAGPLARGGCGIRFKGREDFEAGQWKCVMQVQGSAEVLQLDISEEGAMNDNSRTYTDEVEMVDEQGNSREKSGEW